MKTKYIFSALLVLMVTIVGCVLYLGKTDPVAEVSATKKLFTPDDVKQISQQEAFGLLKSVFDTWDGEVCNTFNNCFDKVLTDVEKAQIALAYGVIDTENINNRINIGLLRGYEVSPNGFATSYIVDDKTRNSRPKEAWFWEIGSCPTNGRIFVGAADGKTGPIHNYVYCGGVP